MLKQVLQLVSLATWTRENCMLWDQDLFILEKGDSTQLSVPIHVFPDEL